MLRTQPSQTIKFSSQMNKPAEQTTFIGKKKVKYLDVALAPVTNENKSGTKSVKVAHTTSNGSSDGLRIAKHKVNALTGKGGTGSISDKGNKFGNSAASSVKTGVTTKKNAKGLENQRAQTFKEKPRFESLKNQTLYDDLDHMLVEKRGMPYPKSDYDEILGNKKEPIVLLTKDSLYPAISKEVRGKHASDPHLRSLVQPNKFLGSNSETFHSRELKAQERLLKLDKIDSFSLGDFTNMTFHSTGKNESPIQQTKVDNSRRTVGIPMHSNIKISRRHIIADIPIYVPSFAGGNQPLQPAVKETQPVPLDKVFERTNQGAFPKPVSEVLPKPHHAPVAFIEPAPGLDTIISEIQGGEPVINTYRLHGNPVTERLMFEKAECERKLLENEQLKYFDSDMNGGTHDKVVRDNRDVSPLQYSDPGARRDYTRELDKLKYSPEHYMQQKEHHFHLDNKTGTLKIAGNLQNGYSEKKSQEKQSLHNQYELDFYAHKTRSDVHRKKDKEDSWIMSKLERYSEPTTVATDNYKSQGKIYVTSSQDSYQAGNNNSYSSRTYNVEENRINKDIDRVSTLDRDSQHSYQLTNNMRNRDRYSDSRFHDREEDRISNDDEEKEQLSYDRKRDLNPTNKYDKKEPIYDDRKREPGYDDKKREPGYDDRKKEPSYDERKRNLTQENKKRELVDDNSRDLQYGDRKMEPNHTGRRRELPQDDRKSDSVNEDRIRVPAYNDKSRNINDANLRKTGYDPKYEHGHDRILDGSNSGQGRVFQEAPTVNRDNFNDRNLQTNYTTTEQSPEKSPPAGQILQKRHDIDRRQRSGSKPPSVGSSVGEESKVQYVLRSKSSNSRNDMRKSQMSYRSGPLPENIPPSSTMLKRDKSSNSASQDQQSLDKEGQKSSPPAFPRQAPIGSNTTIPDNELKNTVVLPASSGNETKVASGKGSNHKSIEELNSYFDESERPDSTSNIIPFYSDTVSRYSKRSGDLRKGLMTPVQEVSIKRSVEDENASIGNKPVDPSDKNHKIKFLSSSENKHTIMDDRRSPWRKNEETTDHNRSPSLRDDPPSNIYKRSDNELNRNQSKAPDSNDQTRDKTRENSKGPDSVEQMRDRIRDKTVEKIEEMREKKEREKTIDSQGPTDKDVELDPVDIDNMNLDDIVTEMDQRELYVCYLLTDEGEKIGPLKLDINDVQLGLPKAGEYEEQGTVKTGGDEENGTIETGEVGNEGMHNRQTGSHGLNEFSSRSHSMLMLTIDSDMQDPDDENLYITKRGKLTFVDLAGSEKVKDSQSTADTLVESNSINKSLLVLGNCISSLGDQKKRQGHIPYRDSKLTKLLADSLGGNGVTLMICCITPSSHHAYETMNTLRYASRAKKIRTKPVIKMDPREKLILTLKREVKVLRNENHYLRQQLDFPAKPHGQIQKENDPKFIQTIKEANGKPDTNGTVNNTNEKLKQNGGSAEESGLYEMLQEYMVENEALRTENAEMQVVRDKIRQEQQLLYRDNEKLMKRVDDLERRLNQAQSSWQSMPRQGANNVREHSPAQASPQYIKGVANGVPSNVSPPARAVPPNDLLLHDNPALRDHVYPGSPPGYASPTNGSNRSKQPLANRGVALKPPHRLAESLPAQQRPVLEQNGAYVNGGPPAQYRTGPIGSPVRDLRNDSRRSIRSSNSDAISDMNEKLKQELVQLDGQIQQHQVINFSKTQNSYGSQRSLR